MQKHLAIFKGNGGELILSGKKTVESRFSKRKSPPFNNISSGDLVYIKPTGKEIIGQFRVQKVIFFDGLEKKDIEEIKLKYGGNIVVEPEYDNLLVRGIRILNLYKFLYKVFNIPN